MATRIETLSLFGSKLEVMVSDEAPKDEIGVLECPQCGSDSVDADEAGLWQCRSCYRYGPLNDFYKPIVVNLGLHKDEA